MLVSANQARLPVRRETHTGETYIERYFYANGETLDVSYPISAKDYWERVGLPDIEKAYHARVRKIAPDGKLELAITPPNDSREGFTIDGETYAVSSFQWFLSDEVIPQSLEEDTEFYFWKGPSFAFVEGTPLLSGRPVRICFHAGDWPKTLYESYKAGRPPHPGALSFREWMKEELGIDEEEVDKVIGALPFPLEKEDLQPSRPLTTDEYISYLLKYGVADGEITC